MNWNSFPKPIEPVEPSVRHELPLDDRTDGRDAYVSLEHGLFALHIYHRNTDGRMTSHTFKQAVAALPKFISQIEAALNRLKTLVAEDALASEVKAE